MWLKYCRMFGRSVMMKYEVPQVNSYIDPPNKAGLPYDANPQRRNGRSSGPGVCASLRTSPSMCCDIQQPARLAKEKVDWAGSIVIAGPEVPRVRSVRLSFAARADARSEVSRSGPHFELECGTDVCPSSVRCRLARLLLADQCRSATVVLRLPGGMRADQSQAKHE